LDEIRRRHPRQHRSLRDENAREGKALMTAISGTGD
jgi:hypothetical protein